MTATQIAQQLADALPTHILQAQIAPTTTTNGYGHKIALTLTDGSAIGWIVIYAGKQGPRYTTNELKLITPEILDAIRAAWITIESSAVMSAHPTMPDSPLTIPPGTIELWVDGACLEDPAGLRFGWAYVIRRDGKTLGEQSGNTIASHAIPYRNVAAEIQAVFAGLEDCVLRGASNVTIFHDYEGLEAWVTGRWNARNAYTQDYATAIRSLPIAITWRKVAAHSGVPLNELVDSLANSAASTSFERHRLPTQAAAAPRSPRS